MEMFAMRMLAELAPIHGEAISENGEEFCFLPLFLIIIFGLAIYARHPTKVG